MRDDDFFLELLIQWTQKGAGLPITLSVGGTIIAGDLISEDEYFDGLAQLYQATDPNFDEDVEHFRELLRSIPHAADQAAMMHLDEGADPEEIRKIRQNWAEANVHLKNTQILLSDGSVQTWLARIIHERLRRLSRERAMNFVPDAQKPGACALSSQAL